jgi:hypothetical protein
VRVERVALEHHRDVAVLRGDVVDHAVADPDLARGGVLEPSHHAQRGRLARPRRADEDGEAAVRDLERELVDGLGAVREDLADPLECDAGHVPSPQNARSRARAM